MTNRRFKDSTIRSEYRKLKLMEIIRQTNGVIEILTEDRCIII